MKTVVIIIVSALVFCAAVSWFLWSGIYNVAATEPHTEFGRWLFTTVRDHSIERRADSIEPPRLTDSSLIQNGARHYSSTCAVCHGAPGEELSEIAKGMNPPAPELHRGHIQKKFTDAEIYWVVEHGIKMTGMPAFGPTHEESDLWAIVAFVKRLPEIEAAQYKSMTQAGAPEDRDVHRASK